MGEHSKISWTDHTFNPWWGCVKVSPACDHCYADSFAGRFYDGKPHEKKNGAVETLPILWGPESARRFFDDKHWNEPLKWNRDALKKLGRKALVFCASMADVFEDRAELIPYRGRLWHLCGQTPHLCWNMLTKRHLGIAEHKHEWSKLPNVHPGVTVENQTYDFRITRDVQWISAEPLLGPLDIRIHMPHWQCGNCQTHHYDSSVDLEEQVCACGKGEGRWFAVNCGSNKYLQWVIVGGESGAGARLMELEWAIDLIQQCQKVGVAVHFKQTGDVLARKLGLKDKSGKDPSEWPDSNEDDPKKSFLCHTDVVLVYPPDSPWYQSSTVAVKKHWEEKVYGFSVTTKEPKGIAVIKITAPKPKDAKGAKP